VSAPAGHEACVREATPADADAVVALVRELGEGFDEPPDIDAAFVGRYLDQPGAGILLAFRAGADEAPIGLLAWSTRPDLYSAAPRGEIEDLVVSAAARGAGVGALLVGEAVARLRTAGCAEVAVITGFENGPARRLYEAAGLRDELLCLHAHFDVST
jgi:GNAT superfamily N-acetyltransferase